MYNPRYHSNCGNFISATFRALTSPLLLRSITEGVYSARAFRSSDSEVIGHTENSAIVSHRPTTLCEASKSNRLHHSHFCDIQICLHSSTKLCACQYLFKNSLKFFYGFFAVRWGAFLFSFALYSIYSIRGNFREFLRQSIDNMRFFMYHRTVFILRQSGGK